MGNYILIALICHYADTINGKPKKAVSLYYTSTHINLANAGSPGYGKPGIDFRAGSGPAPGVAVISFVTNQ